jgi:hypothetical protein
MNIRRYTPSAPNPCYGALPAETALRWDDSMSEIGIIVVIVMCIAGLALLISGIILLAKGGSGAPGETTEASLKEVIRVNVPAQALLVLVGAGLLSGGGYLAVTHTQTSNSSANSSSPALIVPTSSSAELGPSPSISQAAGISQPTAALTSPSNETSVSRSKGFVATGSAANLGPNTIWILDYDGGYTVDQEGKVINGQWSATDQPLGDSSDHLPFNLSMVAVLANPHCAATLNTIDGTSDDYTPSLPQGCIQVGQVTVNVSKP